MLANYHATFTNDEDEDAIIFIEMQKWIALSNIVRDSAEVKSRRVICRKRVEGHMRLWNDYFADEPIYTDYIFRRRFRMRRTLFNRVLGGVTAFDDYFLQKTDALNVVGLSSHQKIAAGIRCLAYGASADIWGEYLCMGETTLLETVKKFAVAIVHVFGEEYGRAPTTADVNRMATENSRRGFPGMLGSIDCMHWEWKNCPTAWHGQYTGHKKAPTVILEAVASYDTWIWKSFFGMPGSCNDLNVLHRSTVFEDLLHGRTPPIQYTVNGQEYDMGYYLADGIYPPYATIVKSVKNPRTQKEKVFSQAQEGARKDVERAFGILQARFAFIRNPAKLWNKEALAVIMKACILLHNMIVEDERRDCNWRAEYDNSEPVPEIHRDPGDKFYAYMAQDAKMRDLQQHQQLRDDLIEHIWSMFGQQQT